MLNIAGALLLSALTAAQPSGAMDTTIVVPAGARLDVQVQGGEIVVDTWNRNEVRIQAVYGSLGGVRVETSGQVIRVRSVGRMASGIVDYRITAPASMDLELGGVNTDVSVRGTQGQVSIHTIQGTVRVGGGSGQVAARTVGGDVVVEGARGTVNARSVGGDVRLRDVQGPIDAYSVSGRVVLEDTHSLAVTAMSVSGHVYFDGSIGAGGRYVFTSHSGPVTVSLPQNPNATLTVAQLSGSFTNTVTAFTATQGSQGRRRTYTAGNGNAMIEVESFSGVIRIVRRGEIAAPQERGRR